MSRKKLSLALFPTALKLSRSTEKKNASTHLRELMEKTGLRRTVKLRGQETEIIRMSSPAATFKIKQDLDLQKKLRKQKKAAALEKQIDQVRKLQTEQLRKKINVKLFDPRIFYLGMNEREALTVGSLLGHEWGTPFFPLRVAKEGGRLIAEKLQAQKIASEVMDAFKTVWDDVLPPNVMGSKDPLKGALRVVLDSLREELKINRHLNPSDFVREKLFNNWRKRFMNALKRKENDGLRTKLKKETGGGLRIETEGSVRPRFVLAVRLGKKSVEIQLDIDHSEERLADAVRMALEKNDPDLLRPVVDATSLRLATSRENSVVFEFVKRTIDVGEQVSGKQGQLSTLAKEELKTYYDKAIEKIDSWREWEDIMATQSAE